MLESRQFSATIPGSVTKGGNSKSADRVFQTTENIIFNRRLPLIRRMQIRRRHDLASLDPLQSPSHLQTSHISHFKEVANM